MGSIADLFALKGLCIIGALAISIQPLLSYLADRKHLRKFPSPSFAGVSSIWRMWHNFFNRHYLVVDAAHRKLGTHVRIAPKCVSILSTQAANEIYGHGANMLKSDWVSATYSCSVTHVFDKRRC